jgi:hypothetical protein
MATMRSLLMFALPLVVACHSSSTPSTTVAPLQPATVREHIPCDSAVVIRAAHEQAGIDAERAWLSDHFPGHSQYSQSLQMGDKRVYDVLTFSTREGHSASICFDITSFFGKY